MCLWIKLHMICLQILRWGTMTALSSDQQREKAVPAQSYVRSLLPQGARGAEGWREYCWEARTSPGSQKTLKFLTGVFRFQETCWNKLWTRMGLLPGEHLRVRYTTLISPPSTISAGHSEPSLRTLEKALPLAGMFETRGSTAVSQQPSKQSAPIPAEKKMHQHLWLHWLCHSQCRRHRRQKKHHKQTALAPSAACRWVFLCVIRQEKVQRSNCTIRPSQGFSGGILLTSLL